MKVLWFANAPLAPACRRLGREPGGSGHWMGCLLDSLLDLTDVHVDVATMCPGYSDDEFTDRGVRHFVYGQGRYESIFTAKPQNLERCISLVRELKPDLLHIHGSERFFGLLPARRLTDVPAIISIQGLAGACLPAFFGALSPAEILRVHTLFEMATRRAPLWRYRDYVKGAALGREILAGAPAFMGRTAWDRAQLAAVNPSAAYFHAGEILRPPFRDARWSLDSCDRHAVFFSNAGSEPRRGLEVLVRAMEIVRRDFPDAELRLAGTLGNRLAYERFVHSLIRDAAIPVRHLGYLDAEQMAAQLRRAHVFALPSFMENSSNSLCEAMQVGVPCVASYAGGIPSLVDSGRTGLLFPPGDAPMLAAAIVRIFRDGEFALQAGRSARAESLLRHDPKRVVNQVLAAYHAVAAGSAAGVSYASSSESR